MAIKKPKKKLYRIHVMIDGRETWKKVFGVPIAIEMCPDIEFFYHKFNGFYRVSEKETCNQVVDHAFDYDDGVDKLENIIRKNGVAEMRRIIKIWKEKRDAVV